MDLDTVYKTDCEAMQRIQGSTAHARSAFLCFNACCQFLFTVQGKLLHRSAYLVGKTPKQQRHDHRSPQLSHDIEQAEGPVAQDGNWAGKAGTHLLQQPLRQCCIGDTQVSKVWRDQAEHVKVKQHRVKLKPAMQPPTILCSRLQKVSHAANPTACCHQALRILLR